MFRASTKSRADRSARVRRALKNTESVTAREGSNRLDTLKKCESVTEWVSPRETEIVRKSKKFYRTVNKIELLTVTFVCENANSMEVSRSCRRGTLLASTCLILRVCIDDQVNSMRGNKIA